MSNLNSPRSAWSGLSLGAKDFATPPVPALDTHFGSSTLGEHNRDHSLGSASLSDHLRDSRDHAYGDHDRNQGWGTSPLVMEPLAARPEPLGRLPLAGGSLGSPSPRTPSQMVQEGPEVARRAAEWERQIESLDAKEMEIHQTQLRLIREQTATFRGDLLALRQEVLELKARDEERALCHGRLERRCSDLSEGLGRHTQLHQDADRRASLHKQSMDKCAQELEIARGRLEQLHGKVADHHSQVAALPERIGYFDKVLNESADKTSQLLREVQIKLEQLGNRVVAGESSHGELKRAHAALAGERAELEARGSCAAERVAHLERLLGESADKQGKELEALRALHAKHAGETKAGHGSLQARLYSLESTIGEATDRQAKELEALKGNHNRMFGGHATFSERLGLVERLLADTADKSAQELAGAQSRLEQLHGRVAAAEAQGAAVEGVKRAHAALAKEKAELDMAHSSIKERVDFLERVMSDSSDKHSREIEDLKATQRLHASDSKARDKAHSEVKDRLEQCVRGHEKLCGHFGSMEDRLACAERATSDAVDKTAVELATVKSTQAKHQTDAKAREVQHATLEDRLRCLEKVLGDSSDKHEQELRGAHARLEQLHGRLQEERKARELHHGAAREQLLAEKEQREAHQASVEERIAIMEKIANDGAEKHGRELEAVRSSCARHLEQAKGYHSRHAVVEERVDYIEQWFRGFRPLPQS